MRKIRNYNTENQTGYKTNYLLLWRYPVRNYYRTGQLDGPAEKLQVGEE